jgi:signal transduction histidine kinase
MSQSILFAGVHQQGWHHLQARFEALGHHVYIMTDDAVDNLPKDLDAIDIVIVMDSISIRKRLQTWDNIWKIPYPPLRVLLCKDTSDIRTVDDFVDIVLNPDSDILEQQILACYNMHHKAQQEQKEHESIQAEWQRQKQAINEFEILKNAVVRNISHELKTPLLQVKSAIALLAEETDSKLITYATNATAKLEILIKNITMLGTSLEVSLVPIIPRDVVESAKRNILRVWEHKDAEGRIQLNLGEGLSPVIADKQGLNTVLQLLLDNALKFSKGTVEICVQEIDDWVELKSLIKALALSQAN